MQTSYKNAEFDIPLR